MILSCIVVVLVIQTLPVFFVKPLGSLSMKGEDISLYYSKGDEKGAREVFDLLQEKGEEIRVKMGYSSKKNTEVIIYKSQKSLAIREAGLITLAIAPPWHIGDSHNGNVMLVSPYTNVKSHTHDSILQAALHEYVHSIVHEINPKLSYFWDNGLATYLAGQKPSDGEVSSMPVPSVEDMHTENGLKFGSMGGYAFSYKYIEFLDNTYGWDRIIAYASGLGSYEGVFGKTEEDIYKEWTEYLKTL